MTKSWGYTSNFGCYLQERLPQFEEVDLMVDLSGAVVLLPRRPTQEVDKMDDAVLDVVGSFAKFGALTVEFLLTDKHSGKVISRLLKRSNKPLPCLLKIV